MVFNENGQAQVWSFEEAVEYKYFKFDKVATQLPELKQIKNEMNELNKYKDIDGEEIYKKKKTFFSVVLKVLRVLESLYNNIALPGGPVAGVVGTAASVGVVKTIGNAVGANVQFSPVSLALNALEIWAGVWISRAINKLIVYAIDCHEEKEVISDVKNVISRLKVIRDKTDDENTRRKINNSIERMEENLNKLQS